MQIKPKIIFKKNLSNKTKKIKNKKLNKPQKNQPKILKKNLKISYIYSLKKNNIILPNQP
jgi:hypothetical protein